MRLRVTPKSRLRDWDEVDRALGEIGRLQAKLAAIERRMNERIDRAKAEAKEASAEINERLAELEQDVRLFCEEHRDEFAARKSKKLNFGTVGFRASTVLKTLSGWTWKKVAAKLEELGLEDFLKRTVSVNKEAIRSSGLPDKLMEEFGVRLVHEDKFYYEIDVKNIQRLKAIA